MQNRPDIQILVDALVRPQTMRDLSAQQWSLLIREARMANVLSRLALTTDDLGLSGSLPAHVGEIFAAAAEYFAYHRQRLRWEVNRVETALRGIDTEILLLKGAAYEFAGLPPARGRVASDLDIMVPADRLAETEATLLDQGWYHLQQDEYDQHYFRSWMHELPPLMHQSRGTILDVHHAILPRTSRLKPDSAKLWRNAVALPETKLFVLSPHDMVLHSAAHAFHDGELRLALRDLADLHDLLTFYGEKPGFWDDLIPRAHELNLTRPLSYALHYAREIFATPIPASVVADSEKFAPPTPVFWLMDRLVPKVLVPAHPDRTPRWNWNATLLLYIRSHWLKMPPLLLTTHLIRKAFIRKKSDTAQA